MLGSAPTHYVWQDTWCDGPQSFDDLSCVIKASGMRVAGSQIPIYSGVAGQFVQSSNKHGDGIAETALEKVRYSNPVGLGGIRMKRAEADGSLQMLDRDIQVTGPKP